MYALGLIFQFGYNIIAAILRAVGDRAATLYFLLIASAANIVLDLLFVAGFKWGVLGAALATDIAQAGSFAAAWFYMTHKYAVFSFRRKDFTWDFSLAKKTMATGLPIASQLIVVSLGLTLIQRAVNEFGQSMIASFTVGNRIEQYINLPCNAFQTTLATYTGQNIGAGKPERVKKGARQAVAISLTMTLVISVLLWLTADMIIRMFGIGGQSAVYCHAHLRALALINLVLSSYIPLFGVFQGTNHAALPMITATCALSTRVAVTYLFRYSPFLGHTIIWWNGIFGFGVGFLITWSYYLSGRWARHVTEPQ